MNYNPEIVFTTLPEWYEKLQIQIENYKAKKENYVDLEKNPVAFWASLLIGITLFVLWFYAFWIVVRGVNLLRQRDMEIPYLFAILVLFLLFYMPLFGMVVVYLLIFPEMKALQ